MSSELAQAPFNSVASQPSTSSSPHSGSSASSVQLKRSLAGQTFDVQAKSLGTEKLPLGSIP